MAIPIELFRFRVVRGVQAQPLNAKSTIDLTALKGFPGSDTLARFEYLTAVIDPKTWTHWLRNVSGQLAVQGDLVDPKGLAVMLPTDWKAQVADATWTSIQLELATSLAVAIKTLPTSPSIDQSEAVEGLARLIRIHDLITILAHDSAAPPEDRVLNSEEDVQAFATYRIISLPSQIFNRNKTAVQLIRQPGITDLYVVKDEWNRYEAGQLARVVNVLPGESFDTRLKHFEKTETTVSTTNATTTSQEIENSQTQSSTLSQSSTKDASLNIGVNGQVEVSGQYGPAQVKTSFGAQLQSSQSESDTNAFTTSMQIVQRSVKQTSQTVIDVQTKRTVQGDESLEDHKLSNPDKTVTVGLYRWLSEIHRVQLEKYPNRFVLEFEIPEPGVWLRWAMQNAPVKMNNPDPGPFRLPGVTHDISPTDLDSNVVAQVSSKWRIQGLDTPPPPTMTVSVVLTIDPTTQNGARFATASDNSMTVPGGYYADSWNAEIFSSRNWALHSYGTELTITVGGGPAGQASTGDLGQTAFVSGPLGGNVGSINTGTIPVTAYTLALQGFTCVINVTCKVMPETVRQWQQTTFDQIAAGYQSLLTAYQQELAASALQPGSLAGLVGPPDLNRERATSELRRLVIENLMSQRFNGEPAIVQTTPASEPNVNLAQALGVGPTVQFFEQVFEWENLIYICYPYYWSRRSEWAAYALTATADPEFDQFLNSGSARVVVPARPGFEDVVNFYLNTGIIWSGTRPPAPNDPDYLSIAQEIQAMQVGATDGTPVGSSWEISLPTTLLWAGTDPTTLPTNPNAKIPAPTN